MHKKEIFYDSIEFKLWKCNTLSLEVIPLMHFCTIVSSSFERLIFMLFFLEDTKSKRERRKRDLGREKNQISKETIKSLLIHVSNCTFSTALNFLHFTTLSHFFFFSFAHLCNDYYVIVQISAHRNANWCIKGKIEETQQKKMLNIFAFFIHI